ncbi:MAG: hypothetical protein RLY31_150 [Bacteroidota bacterium]|jgi:arabinogalactan endo-1,4-beta-galactosidase
MHPSCFLLSSVLALALASACEQTPLPDTGGPEEPSPPTTRIVKALDLSGYPEIADAAAWSFRDADGRPADLPTLVRDSGVNTIRLKLWVAPDDPYAGLPAVTAFSQSLRLLGFDIWLTLHYSDTWADPGQQTTPVAWQGIGFSALQDSVRHHTRQVMKAIQPDIIQVGNEINNGFLHPAGQLSDHPAQFRSLLESAVQTVRQENDSTRILLHFAGIQGADWFFQQVASIDYDLIGLSYYPRWHGKDTDALAHAIRLLGETHQRPVLIAETAYPFTLQWNDWTHNVVGLEDQLILPGFPATPAGQKAFLQHVRDIVETTPAAGWCYWGAALVAWKGSQATDGSPWENQALFDFDGKALPALGVFR